MGKFVIKLNVEQQTKSGKFRPVVEYFSKYGKSSFPEFGKKAQAKMFNTEKLALTELNNILSIFEKEKNEFSEDIIEEKNLSVSKTNS